MCGIAGIYRKSGDVLSGHLEAAVGKLSHRGPDDRGYYIYGSLGMGHTRLSIIDLEGGRQPLYAEDDDLKSPADPAVGRKIRESREIRDAVEKLCELDIRIYEEALIRFH